MFKSDTLDEKSFSNFTKGWLTANDCYMEDFEELRMENDVLFAFFYFQNQTVDPGKWIIAEYIEDLKKEFGVEAELEEDVYQDDMDIAEVHLQVWKAGTEKIKYYAIKSDEEVTYISKMILNLPFFNRLVSEMSAQVNYMKEILSKQANFESCKFFVTPFNSSVNTAIILTVSFTGIPEEELDPLLEICNKHYPEILSDVNGTVKEYNLVAETRFEFKKMRVGTFQSIIEIATSEENIELIRWNDIQDSAEI